MAALQDAAEQAGPEPGPSGSGMAAKLDTARRDLLDLGLRNSLLNYRLLKARGLEATGEHPAEVYRLLVHDGRALHFVPAPAEGSPPPPAAPNQLQTPFTESQLQARLLATYYAARTAIEEQGVNILFLALGMLEWYEDDHSQEIRRAPLLLLPVTLERSNARERFQLRGTGDEAGGNLSLIAKLRAEWGLTVPEPPDAEDLDIDAYLETVAVAVERQARWQVDRTAVVLGFFSFAKYLMFKDLEANVWPQEQQPAESAIIQALLGTGFREPPSPFSDEQAQDALPEVQALRPVMDADSSQTLAVLDVLQGRNLVIQGPPGTGKSQTIANIIAEAAGSGRTVLFVAEKLAALEVVKRRLDRVGLGDACLELHSNKTQKKALLNELARTMQLGRPLSVGVEDERARLKEAQDRLNDYAEAMNSTLGESGLSPYAALGAVVHMQQQCSAEALKRLPIGGLAEWSGADLRRRESLVEDLQSAVQIAGIPTQHPFWGSRRTIFLPTQREQLTALLQEALAATEALQTAGSELAGLRAVESPVNRPGIEELFPPGWQLWRQWFGGDREARGRARAALAAHADQLARIREFLEFDDATRLPSGRTLESLPFTEQAALFQTWLDHAGALETLAAFNQSAEACRAESLAAVLEPASTWPRAGHDLVSAFRWTWFSTLLERAYAERPSLARFQREPHESVLARFRQLDTALAAVNSSALARRHYDALPHRDGGGQLAVLKREFEKKSRHLPIRQVMVKAGNPIQAIKPIFMMSPLSIANYLPPGSVTFDLVIFDEASQVRPVDAFGALLRARQAVVVGDSKQLPPTSFFDALVKGDDLDDEEDATTTADIESILSLFSAQLAPSRMLRWHYRSRHESLIAVSNHSFYQDRLIVFPSPDAERRDTGLVYHRIENSSYDRGRTRTNQVEAEAVAQAVMTHARERPQQSLGVAAFSVAQMQAILDRLELLRRADPSTEDFFTTRHPHEPFFVKNLESVQGDERDVMFISVGYGRTAEGYLAMNFGPLNGEGGERRLNVLITRARERCEVFTNLSADDIVADGKGAGIQTFKLFLRYAETGILDVPVVTGREADSEFEIAVQTALEERGYLVRRQVGSAGFRLDLAVADAEHPGRYLLGIECDGASYHSARSARDRDRLRQQVLEGLGWTIHRIWSTDWFRDPAREVQRAVEAIEAARATADRESPTGNPVPDELGVTVLRDDSPAPSPPTDILPYRRAMLQISTDGRDLYEVQVERLVQWIVEVVEVESPVHRVEVARRIAEAVGVTRVGRRIENAFAQATFRAPVQRRGEFLWRRDMSIPPVRNRAELPAGARTLELVAPEEIEQAVLQAITSAYGISAEQLPPTVCRLFGLQRAGSDARVLVEQVLTAMLAAGKLIEQNGILVLAR